MKKVKLIISAIAMLGLVLSSTAFAADYAPAEGLYLGALAGSGSGFVQPKVQTSTGPTDNDVAGTYQATEGGLGLFGIEGGVVMGYGYKMGNLYAGLEGEWLASDVEFKLTSSVEIETGNGGADNTFTEVSAKKTYSGGAFGRVGYYINPSTLFSIKGGVLVSEFDVAYVGNNSQSETYYAGGPAVGLAMESNVAAIDPNLNIRIGAVYTDFLTASVQGIGSENGGGDVNSEVTGESLSARVGLTYSFFDVNSLF